MTSTTSPAISLENLSKSFGSHRAIGRVDLDISPGEFVSLLGPSGCGKSTILRMIAGLEHPSGGRLASHGEPITGPSPERGVVFQNHALLPWMSARKNIDFALTSARPSLDRAERHRLAETWLDRVGLKKAADRKPSALSGGMQQRVGLARAFAIDPDVLLLDEPFGALDALTRSSLQEQLLEVWQAHRRTVVMVTHDIPEALLLSDRIVVMSTSPDSHVEEVIDVPNPRNPEADRSGLADRLTGLLRT